MPNPLFSVIVVCRNPGPRLRAALESVWAQEDARAELVVVDGASTDGTAAWLESCRPRLAALRSEPDAGVYDAMNKAVGLARGDWVLFLGADDRLAGPRVLGEAAVLLPAAGVAAGTARYDDGRHYAFTGTAGARRRNFVHHQAAFYRRELFARMGGFDAGLRRQADYDFNLRLLAAGVPFAPLPLLVAECGSGGLSDAGRWANYREEITVRHRHFPAWRCWGWDAVAAARYVRKRLRR